MVDAVKHRKAGRASATYSLLGSSLVAIGLALSGPSCLEQRSSAPRDYEAKRCASCHGDAARAGDFLARAAPPSDLLGRTQARDPGVGAHAQHLHASPTHAAVSCSECHVVPESTEAPGHADDARPAEVTFGVLARHADREPRYDFGTRSCNDSYCHGDARPRWTAPKSSEGACGTCHGLPPASPHPQSDDCSQCHGEVIDAQRRFVAPERHVDGVVNYAPGECRQCHGSENNDAPPRDLSGRSSTSALGVGAHQRHLEGGSGRPLACVECHVVPKQVEAPQHIDGLPAEVTLAGVAESHGRAPLWDRGTASCGDSWCHAPTAGTHANAIWNEPTTRGCQACHGTPPAAPHPQIEDCSRCHGAVVEADDRTLRDRTRHVDGKVNLDFDQSCNSCHGSVETPAPPTDLAGNLATSAPGVGAHQTHLLGTPHAAKVTCETCHLVPATALANGHIDTSPPAEVVFSGAALAFGAKPVYQDGSCQNTSCHGAVLPRGHASGGSNNRPSWAIVDGSQASCGTCHGLPPPAPHPLPTFPCHDCHFNVADDDVSFLRPDLHVDGVVTFALP